MRRFPGADMIITVRSTLVTNVRGRREVRFAAMSGCDVEVVDRSHMRIQALTGLPMVATPLQLEVERHQLRLRELRLRR